MPVPPDGEDPRGDEGKGEDRSESKPSDPWEEVRDPWQSRWDDEDGPSYDDFAKFWRWWQTSGGRDAQSWGRDRRQWREAGTAAWNQWHGAQRRGRREERDRDRRERWEERGRDRRQHGGSEKGEREKRVPGAEKEAAGDTQRKQHKKKEQAPLSPDGPSDPDESEPNETSSSTSVRTSEVRSLLAQKWKNGQSSRPKSSLGSVKIEDFYAKRQRYKGWRRVVRAQQQLYQLEDSELSMLIYLSCKKDARDVLDQLTIEMMVKPGGLQAVWELLDEAYDETNEEVFERVESEFMNYRRTPGQSVASYLAQIKRLKAEYAGKTPGRPSRSGHGLSGFWCERP